MAKKIMSMMEIDKVFDKLSADSNMRALSAVLRIGAEQIENRGKLGFLKNIVIFTGLIAVAFTAIVPFLPQKQRTGLQIWVNASVILCVVCLAFLWRSRSKLELYLEEEKRIRAMMLEHAEKITSDSSFTPTPLSAELRGTLRDALRHSTTKVRDELSDLAERDA